MLIVNVFSYGNFDMKCLESTWYHETLTSLKETGLSSSLFDNTQDPNDIVKELKKHGFRKAKTASLTCGGNF